MTSPHTASEEDSRSNSSSSLFLESVLSPVKLSDIGLDLTAHTTTPSAMNIDVDMKKQKKRRSRGTLDPNSRSAALNIADSFISGPIGVMLGLQGGAGTVDLDSRPSSVPIVIIESQNVKKQLPIFSSSSSASRGLLRESATASTASPSVSALHATQHTPSTPPISLSHHSASEAFSQLRGESSNSKYVGRKHGTIEHKEEVTLSADKTNFELQSGRIDESDIADEAVARRLYRQGWTVKNGGWVADFGSSRSSTTKLRLQDYQSRQPLHGDGALQDGVCLPVERRREGRSERYVRSGSESGHREGERGGRVGMRESPPDKEASLGDAFREERRGEKLCKEGEEERKDEVQELEDIEVEDALEREREAYAEKEKQREEGREELRRKKYRRERLMVREKERARLLEVELEKDRLWEEEMLREQESESEWQREQELMRTREKERARAREWEREELKVKASEREAILAAIRKLEEEREASIDIEWQMKRERRKERDEIEIRKERERQKGNDLDDETLGARVPEERFQGLHMKEDEKCKTSEMARSSIKAQVNRIVGQTKEVEMKVAVEEESGVDQQIIEKKVDERTLEECSMEEKQITSRPNRRASAKLGKIAEGSEEAIDFRIEGKEVEKEEVSNEVQWEKEIKRIREALNETERINEAEKVRERQRERERESIIGRDGAPGPRSLVLPAQVTTDSLVSPHSDGDGGDVSSAGALSQGRKDLNTSRAHCTGEVEGIAEPASPFSPFNTVISSPTQLNTSLDSLRASIGISLLNPKPPHFSSSSDTSCAASLELKTLFWGGARGRPGSEVANKSPLPSASPPHTPSHTMLSSLLPSPAIIVRSAETEIEVTSHAVGQGLGPGAYPDVLSPTDTATVMTSTISIVTAPAISISTATSVTSQIDPAFSTPSRTQSTGSSRRNSSASVGEKMTHERRHSSQSSVLGHDTVAPPGTRTPPVFNSNSRYSSGSGGVGEMRVAAYAKGESVRMMEDRNEEPHAFCSDRTSEKRDDRGWELTGSRSGSGGSGRDGDVTLSPPESPLTDTSHGVGDLMYSDLGIMLSLAVGQGAFRSEGRRKKERLEEGENGGGEVRVGRIEINTPDVIREEALGGREKGGRSDTSLEGQHDSHVFDFYPASPLYPVTPYGDSMYVTILNLTHMR